jgi:hypothetical protein
MHNIYQYPGTETTEKYIINIVLVITNELQV